MQTDDQIKTFAAYLPQFHEIPENNKWWGDGFTEWTHLNRAKSWTQRHQIRQPHDSIGQYNLLNPQTIESQYSIAKNHNITGFAVWHYWFGRGQKILEKPIELVLSRKLNFKYCLAWANHSWMDKSKNRLLMQQEYLGASDYLDFYRDSHRHFATENYIKIDNKPVFFIFDPSAIPDFDIFYSTWDQAARDHGFDGIYFLGDKLATDSPLATYFEGVSNGFAFWTNRKKMVYNLVKEKARTKLGLCWSPQMYEYESMLRDAIPKRADPKYIPTAISGWDTTPRHGKRGAIFYDFNEKTFQAHLSEVSKFILETNPKNKIIFLKSWNEWAEGNCIEPDNISGYRLLEVYRDNIDNLRKSLSCADNNKSTS